MIERFGMPMGPLELLDQVGIDVAAHVAETLTALSPQPSPTPDCLRKMSDDGALGRKANRGFYSYVKGKKGPANPQAASVAQIRSPMT